MAVAQGNNEQVIRDWVAAFDRAYSDEQNTTGTGQKAYQLIHGAAIQMGNAALSGSSFAEVYEDLIDQINFMRGVEGLQLSDAAKALWDDQPTLAASDAKEI